MRIAIFGGSFNPPHKGHVVAALSAMEYLNADKLIVIPAFTPPHKEQAAETPDTESRFLLTKLAFQGLPNVEVSDIEIKRGGKSYTVDTLETLKNEYPEAELYLLIGSDMIFCFDKWKDYHHILELCKLAVFSRENGDEKALEEACSHYERECGKNIIRVPIKPTEISSTELRQMLKTRKGEKFLEPSVYAEIIRCRYYGAKPNFFWLRQEAFKFLDEKRIGHVIGCEKEAIRLAEWWDADAQLAAEAAILHDITKKIKGSEQLKLCDEYGIITDENEKSNFKLLHAKTGAAFARKMFGISNEVYEAIYWHTTGKENMTLLEKIIYIADYIEMSRSFEGVDKLRHLAYEDLDKALILGLEMSMHELESAGIQPHINSVKALNWLMKGQNDNQHG